MPAFRADTCNCSVSQLQCHRRGSSPAGTLLPAIPAHPSPAPGRSSIPSAHTEVWDHCTLAALLQHTTFGRSKSPAKTNLHTERLTSMLKSGKPNYYEKKILSVPAYRTSFLSGQSFNIQQSQNSLSMHLQLSHTFYTDTMLPPKSPDHLFPSNFSLVKSSS